MKACANIYQKCENLVSNPRKKFCCDFCKYWFNSIRKEKEAHLPPVKKRTKEYFAMVTGSERANKGTGQGRRSGSTVRGSMSDFYLLVAVEEWMPFTIENVNKHFDGIPGHIPNALKLGDGERLTKQEALKLLN